MFHYQYEARDSGGEMQQGELRAASVGEAVRQIEELGLELVSIRLVPVEVAEQNERESEFHAKLNELLASRSTWVPALRAMVDELPAGRQRKETRRIVESLEADLSPSTLLERKDCAALLPLLTAGVESKYGSDSLKRWLNTVVQQRQLAEQRLRAIAYPAVLLILATALSLFLGLFVVPIFKEMFTDFGLTLPAPTLLLIWLSDQMTTYWLRTLIALAIGGAVVFVGAYCWRRQALTNRLLGSVVAGTGVNLRAMSNFTSVLAELLSLDAPVVLAVESAGRSCGHRLYDDAAKALSKQMANRNSAELDSTGLPPLVMHALRPLVAQRPDAGRQTVVLDSEQDKSQQDTSQQDTSQQGGVNDASESRLTARKRDGASVQSVGLLRELSFIYSDRAQHRVSVIATALPAFATLVIGFVVGFVVVALFMPLVTLVSSLA